MTDLRETAVPEQRQRGLDRILRTSPATEEAVRTLTRAMAVALGRNPTHDEVIAAAVSVAEGHMPDLVNYLKGDE